jgi:hypothetical protein
MPEHRRRETLLSNAQVWYCLIAATVLLFLWIMSAYD